MFILSEPFLKLRDSLLDDFEQSRVDIGKKAIRLSTLIRDLVKDGIKALKREDWHRIDEVRRQIVESWQELGTAEIPADLRWRYDAECGQEMVEFEWVVKLYLALFQNSDVDFKSISPEVIGKLSPEAEDEFGMTPQQWLAGITDAPTELGKILEDYVNSHDLSPEEYLKLWEKFLAIVKEIVDFLDPFENIYGLVINNSRMRGFRNTFRGRHGRLRGFLERQKRELLIFKMQLKLQQ